MVAKVGNVNDDNKNSFINNTAGEVARNVVAEIIGAIAGTFTPTGAQVLLNTAELTISSTAWTEIILEKATRNGLNIQNRSSTEDNGISDIFTSGLNTDVSTPIPIGAKVPQGGERQYAISAVSIYVKAKSGTPTITIEAIG